MSHLETTNDSAPVKRPSAVKTFLVSGIGTALEYYDFLIYGLAAGLVFNEVFFPNSDPLIGTLYAFAAFGTGFVARPLGGIVIGHFGDRIGRRSMLIMTLIVMGVSTFAIGLLPTFESVGLWAPVFLVVLRLVQGFAAGGEWGGAALFGLEYAPEGQRGLWGSFTSMGIGLGTLIGVSVFSIVSYVFDGDLVSFAWRVPFWIGGLIVIVGLFARLSMPSVAHEPTAAESQADIPLVEAVKRDPKSIALGLGVSFGYNTIAYIGFTFFLSYLTNLGYRSTDSLTGQLAYSAVLIVSAPTFALLSDRIGRKPVMVAGGVLTAAFLFVYFPLVGTLNVGWAIVAFAVTGLLTGITQGPIPAFTGEQFPARFRYSAMSVSYQIGAAIGGGSASFIATGLLIISDQNPISVALYGSFAMLVLVVCSLGLRETAFMSTDKINS
ncbi:MFS transporter [Brevibacterium sp. SMBL_HHYL_HB1]|uniref:MFS transporter n=1 Tax=Brevibacterium sp. SMBL_HHYL_HB1 TaxID=2777556 RepID=UPI001BA61281|nr:MFS transporter [Brevibacterium sp. SMBL_HHYL_HB1]QUL77881.1 MFS transporter [Brevibacterium sp. SMBL_HHYL_HB1]